MMTNQDARILIEKVRNDVQMGMERFAAKRSIPHEDKVCNAEQARKEMVALDLAIAALS